jgi:dihydrofolate reductase
MKLSILVAASDNGVIGVDGGLPWHLPAELQRLKQLTTGHTLLMGRKTFESIGRPLPNRTSIVITSNPDFQTQATSESAPLFAVSSLAAAIELARERGEDEAFVFGGARVYAEALPLATQLYLTRVHCEVEGDAHLPEYDEHEWKQISAEDHPADARHAQSFTFETYERVSAASRKDPR